jgi:hypothetical protein
MCLKNVKNIKIMNKLLLKIKGTGKRRITRTVFTCPSYAVPRDSIARDAASRWLSLSNAPFPRRCFDKLS